VAQSGAPAAARRRGRDRWRRRWRYLGAGLLGALLIVAGCGPTGPGLDPSPEAQAAPRPLLTPTAPLRALLATAGPDARRLAEDAEALDARAAALRERAAALGGPVVDPARRPRLLEAAEGAADGAADGSPAQADP
jgi:hypothetical protein